MIVIYSGENGLKNVFTQQTKLLYGIWKNFLVNILFLNSSVQDSSKILAYFLRITGSYNLWWEILMMKKKPLGNFLYK